MTSFSKSLVAAFVLGSAGFAFANETKTEAPAKEAAVKVATAGTVSKKDAKVACKAEGKKGKDLAACVKEKVSAK